MSSAGISFGGLASGLDTRAIISALVSLERRPINQLEFKKSQYTKHKSLFGDLNGLLEKLETAAKALKTTNSFLSMKASSDDKDVLTATATTAATPGTHTVRVLDMARAQVNHTSGSASATAGLGSYGEFTLDVGGNTHVISITNPTLQDIANAINATGAEVTAEVVDTGAATDPFQLVLRATETGAENGFSISAVSGDPAFEDLVTDLTDPANVRAAQDARIELNGIQIFRPTNSVSGAVAGVTFDLKSMTAGLDEVTVTIATDAEEVSKKVQEFVDAYNAVVDFHEAQNVLDEEGQAKSGLFGDSTLRSMRSSLRSIVGGTVPTTGNPAYQMLSQIGIEADTQGKLTFTASKLEEALADDEQAVASIFTDATNGISQRLVDQTKVFTDSIDGLIKTRLDGFDRLVKQATNRIEQAERRLEQFEKALEVKYANLESLLSRLQSQGSSLSILN